jgi:photosystem II PsbY protein
MSAAAASLMVADSASAATEVAQLADSDGRLAAILTLFVPAVGWVLFNILGPAQRQLQSMASADAPKKATKRRGVAAAVGMGAAAMTMMAAESANAATEFAQVADSDGRLAAILTLFVPAIGWVLFNILGPAQRQLESMASEDAPKKATKSTKRRGVAAGLGMSAAAASLMLADSASAANEFAQVADSDGRLAAILTLFVPAIGWVLFNILGPAQRQLQSMASEDAPKKATKRRGVAAAVGMGAAAMSMVAAESASAATELAQVADSDGHLAAILTLFVPALGWVAFNIFGPALRQLDSMSAPETPKKGTVRRK